MAKRIGVLLSGCGVMDGSEIHEAVLTLQAIDSLGAEAVCMAPNVEQLHVVNHATGQPVEGQSRNIMVEAARIARGKIQDLASVKADDIDALVLPGGYGAAKNLCTYAVDGVDCTVNPEVDRLIREVNRAGKPICAICIAPVVVAKVLGKDVSPTLTIGSDPDTAMHIEQMGANHANSPVRECVVDRENKIVSTPAYMLAQSIGEAAAGIEKAVRELGDMA
jgi:enhancing lycopene biosynthesis protein 2